MTLSVFLEECCRDKCFISPSYLLCCCEISKFRYNILLIFTLCYLSKPWDFRCIHKHNTMCSNCNFEAKLWHTLQEVVSRILYVVIFNLVKPKHKVETSITINSQWKRQEPSLSTFFYPLNIKENIYWNTACAIKVSILFGLVLNALTIPLKT